LRNMVADFRNGEVVAIEVINLSKSKISISGILTKGVEVVARL